MENLRASFYVYWEDAACRWVRQAMQERPDSEVAWK